MELRGICSWELVEANTFTLSNTATFLIPCYMGTLIKIRNVCLSYWKSGVLPFFQDIGRKKMELYGFFGNYSLKKCGVIWFFGSYSKKMGNTLVPRCARALTSRRAKKCYLGQTYRNVLFYASSDQRARGLTQPARALCDHEIIKISPVWRTILYATFRLNM